MQKYNEKWVNNGQNPVHSASLPQRLALKIPSSFCGVHLSSGCLKPWTTESEHSSVSLAQSGIADIQSWVAYMGPLWCGEPSETQTALEHTLQAISYLLIGKDECVRKAAKVSAVLSRLSQARVQSFPTPALTA